MCVRECVHDLIPYFMVSLEGDGSKDQLKSVQWESIPRMMFHDCRGVMTWTVRIK